MTKTVLVSGGFDPLHSGHIEYFKAARQLGDRLWVAVNSDEWLSRKKGRPFMPLEERCKIIRELSMVDNVISDFDDSDGSASMAIHKAMNLGAKQILFANGGDRAATNTPEQTLYGDNSRVEFVWGVGGEDKLNSSSWILKDWSAPKTERSWGHYRNLYRGEGFMVKELVIDPGSKLSMQRHWHRSETWNLVSGQCAVLCSTSNVDPWDGAGKWTLGPHNPVEIPRGVWHQGINPGTEPAHIIEVWRGNQLSEDDIERWDDESR